MPDSTEQELIDVGNAWDRAMIANDADLGTVSLSFIYTFF